MLNVRVSVALSLGYSSSISVQPNWNVVVNDVVVEVTVVAVVDVLCFVYDSSLICFLL